MYNLCQTAVFVSKTKHGNGNFLSFNTFLCSHFQLSTWAMFGAAADKEMGEGKVISNELLVGIIAEAIR